MLSGIPCHAKWDSMGGSDASATHQQHGQLARTGRRGAGGGVGQQRQQLVDDEMRQHARRPRDLQRGPHDASAPRGTAGRRRVPRELWRRANGPAAGFKRALGEGNGAALGARRLTDGQTDPLQRGVDGPRVRRPLGRAGKQRVVPAASVPAQMWLRSRRRCGPVPAQMWPAEPIAMLSPKAAAYLAGLSR